MPIGHITNGIHVRTWLAQQMHQLYDRHLGPGWTERCAEPATWDAIDGIEDGELWETRQTLKTELIEAARLRAARCADERGESIEFVDQVRHALSLDALTIGFARRFATYKRANLVLRDLESLVALVNDAKVPIQFVFAGKAHPRDAPGKEVLQEVFQLLRDPRFAGKLLFIEDYDINVGPVSRAGRRRLAQHAAPSARSVGHERSESRAERRTEPVDPRRVVGGGLRRPQRFRHRTRRDAHLDRRARRARCRSARPECFATKSYRCITTVTAMDCRAGGSRG